MAGWIKLHRQITDSLVFKNEKCLKVWIWCLVKANHQENKTMIGRTKVTVEKGSFVMGSHTAKETLDMAISTIWYWLRFLEVEGMVEIKNTNKYSVVKLKKWSEYQEAESKSESNAQADGKQMETNKKVKNVKKDSEIKISRSLQELSYGLPRTTLGGLPEPSRSPLDIKEEKRVQRKLSGMYDNTFGVKAIKLVKHFCVLYSEKYSRSYGSVVKVDTVAKNISTYFKDGETVETLTGMIDAYFESKKGNDLPIKLTTAFSDDTYRSWTQGKLGEKTNDNSILKSWGV